MTHNMTHNMTHTRNFTGLGQPSQPVIIEHSSVGYPFQQWLVWLSYNEDRTRGTYLELHDDGTILRHTINNDGSLDTVTIKAPKALAWQSTPLGHVAKFDLSPELLEQLQSTPRF